MAIRIFQTHRPRVYDISFEPQTLGVFESEKIFDLSSLGFEIFKRFQKVVDFSAFFRFLLDVSFCKGNAAQYMIHHSNSKRSRCTNLKTFDLATLDIEKLLSLTKQQFTCENTT